MTGVDRPVMIHDMALTERWAVLVVGPLFFDLAAALATEYGPAHSGPGPLAAVRALLAQGGLRHLELLDVGPRWVLSRLDGPVLDPAEAARTVIAGLGEGELALPQQRRLLDLLATTTRWPRAAVAGLRHGLRQGRRRRGIAIG